MANPLESLRVWFRDWLNADTEAERADKEARLDEIMLIARTYTDPAKAAQAQFLAACAPREKEV